MDSNVFVKFLPSDLGDDGLHALFCPFGAIESAKVMVNVATGDSLGYGFVRFTNSGDAAQAINAMMGYRIGNKTLMCKISNSFTFAAPSPNLYIKPLPLDISEDGLKCMFERFGTIVDAKIITHATISGNNFGFVRYSTVESASHAIQEMNGTKILGQHHLLMVKYAESDTQRAVRKANIEPAKMHSTKRYTSTMAHSSAPRNSNQPPAMFMAPVMFWSSYAYVPQPNLSGWAPAVSPTQTFYPQPYLNT